MRGPWPGRSPFAAPFLLWASGHATTPPLRRRPRRAPRPARARPCPESSAKPVSGLREDLAVLAWAVAVNSGDVGEVESLLTEAFPLCGTKTKPVLAELHYHAGRAYEALSIPEKTREHFRQAIEADPKGIFGRLAR